MEKTRILLALSLTLSALLLQPVSAEEATIPSPRADQFEYLSKTFVIDKKYPSMTGPFHRDAVTLLNTAQPELIWITGVRVEVVSEDGLTSFPPQFMCHLNFDYNRGAHSSLVGWEKSAGRGFWSLFLLSQGSIFADLPQGFGIPMFSNEMFYIGTMVLNANEENPNLRLKQKLVVEYTRDRDLTAPLTPLLPVLGEGLSLVTDEADAAHCDMSAASCSIAAKPSPFAVPSAFRTIRGQKYTEHWMVPPGRQVARTNITDQMNLPYNTTLHFAMVHLHPYSEWIELRDITANKTVFRCYAYNYKDKIGLKFLEYFSSKKGVRLYKDHQYEMVCSYNNPTDQPTDAMATMVAYVVDKEFKKSKLKP